LNEALILVVILLQHFFENKKPGLKIEQVPCAENIEAAE